MKYILYLIIFCSPISGFSQILHEGIVFEYSSSLNQHSIYLGAKSNGIEARNILGFFNIKWASKDSFYLDAECNKSPFHFNLKSTNFALDYSTEFFLFGFDIIPYDKYSNNKSTFSFIPSLFSCAWRILCVDQRKELIDILGNEELYENLTMIPALIINSKNCVSLYSNNNIQDYRAMSVYVHSKLDYFIENHKSNLLRYQPEIGFQYLFLYNGENANGFIASLGVKYIIDYYNGNFEKTSFRPTLGIGCYLGSLWYPGGPDP